mgnify:CR=1 FL=1|jgi:protein required for attachment to host cells
MQIEETEMVAEEEEQGDLENQLAKEYSEQLIQEIAEQIVEREGDTIDF